MLIESSKGDFMSRQTELIKHLDDKEVLLHLYLSQFILLVIALLLGFFFFSDLQTLLAMWQLDIGEIMLYGGGSAFVVIIIDSILMKVLPKEMYDDGGINEKVFRTRPIWHIFMITLIVAFTEELLFRGVIQTHLGYVPASLMFAFLHFRYLYKWLLFTIVVSLSFLLGWIYLETGNLLTTITSHFLIDFVFALMIRMNYLKKQKLS